MSVRAKHKAANSFDVIPVGGFFYLSVGLAEANRGEPTDGGIPYSTEIVWDRVYLMSIKEITSLKEMLERLMRDLESGKAIVTPLVESEDHETRD